MFIVPFIQLLKPPLAGEVGRRSRLGGVCGLTKFVILITPLTPQSACLADSSPARGAFGALIDNGTINTNLKNNE